MSLNVQHPDLITTQPAAPVARIAPTPATNVRTGFSSLITRIGVLASLMEPQAAVALANGVPNLDSDTLVRLLNESSL